MNTLLLACLFLPLLGFLGITIFGHNEKIIAQLSFFTTHAMGLSIFLLLTFWASHGFPSHEFQWFIIYERGSYQFPLLFFLDKISATYLFAVWIIFSVIVRYCRNYLHREAGYKRFFLTIFAFAFGLNMVVLSGSIDVLFAGWEIVGISSFLLIAFYRERIQPVRNALRAYSVYRFCDIGLLLGSWMSHLLFHGSDHFSNLTVLFEHAAPPADFSALLLMSVLIFIAATGKSAQFPFCFWLPRAMEGPTPSSAIFYGALSVHLGVFLLLRTAPIWSYHSFTRVILFSIGLLTVIIASLAEKTQSNIKGQVAYASITQVGFMFIELSVGLEDWVLVHFLGNASLRCYQLLVSPSIVSHMLRIEGASDTRPIITKAPLNSRLPVSIRDTLPDVLQNTLYVFALQEGFLELLSRRVLWSPLKYIGRKINKLDQKIKYLTLLGVCLLFITSRFTEATQISYFAIPTAMAMIAASLSAFSEKHSFIAIWNAVAVSCFFAASSVWFIHPSDWSYLLLFLAGIIPSWLVGFWILHHLPTITTSTETPFAYLAMAETHPHRAIVLFISVLGLICFPITPAFIGEDILLYHASSHHNAWLSAFIAISFVINGIAVARLYLRICMGRPAEVMKL